MILTRIWYKIDDGKLLAIIEIFKTWKHYLKSYKYEIIILIDYNNFQYFIDI